MASNLPLAPNGICFASLSSGKTQLPAAAFPIYEDIRSYAVDFLRAQHPYRSGSMCPFMPGAVSNDGIFFFYLEDEKVEVLRTKLQEVINHYLKVEEHFGDSQTAVFVMFPAVFNISKMLDLHFYFKTKTIEKFIMIGATYSENDA
jgi:hypothetical protein